MKYLDKNPSFSQIPEVNKICQPLFNNFDINSFFFCKVKANSNFFILANNHFGKHWFTKQYSGPGVLGENTSRSGIYINQTMLEISCKNDLLSDMRNEFNMHHPVFFIDNQTTHYYLYGFAAPENSKSDTAFFLNNIEMLQHFVDYFQEKAADLIVAAEEKSIIVPEKYKDTFSLHNTNYSKQAVCQDFFSQTPISQFRLRVADLDIVLTKREVECLVLLVAGKNSKEIAQTMAISPKTVEHYIQRLKLKLKTRKRKDIVPLFMASNLKYLLESYIKQRFEYSCI